MRAHADPHPARAHQQQRRACARLPRRAPGRAGPGQVQLRRIAAVGARLAQLLWRAEVPDDDGVDHVRAGVRESGHQPDDPDRADAALRRGLALDGGTDDRRRPEGRLPARYGGAEPEAVAVLPVAPGLRPLHRVLPQLDGLHEDRAGGSLTLAQGGPLTTHQDLPRGARSGIAAGSVGAERGDAAWWEGSRRSPRRSAGTWADVCPGSTRRSGTAWPC